MSWCKYIPNIVWNILTLENIHCISNIQIRVSWVFICQIWQTHPRVRGMLGSLLPGSRSQVLLQRELPWQPEQALLESLYLSSFTSPPCSELLSVSWMRHVMLLLASGLSTSYVLCPSSSLSSPHWLSPIDLSGLHLESLLPGSLPGHP